VLALRPQFWRELEQTFFASLCELKRRLKANPQ
jgi:hypothetical protein